MTLMMSGALMMKNAKNGELLDKALEEAEDFSEIDVLSDDIKASYRQNWVSGNGCESELNNIRVYDFSKIDWEKSFSQKS